MESKAIKFLRGNSSCAFGMVEDLSLLYVPMRGVEINAIPNMLINKYWLKEDFDITKAVISFCIQGKNYKYTDDGNEFVTYFFNVLVTDILSSKKGVKESKLKYNSVEVTYARLTEAFPNLLPITDSGLKLEDYIDFLYKILCDLSEIATIGFPELSKIAEKSFEGLDPNNLRTTVNCINNLGKTVPYINKTYLPNITLESPNYKRDGKDALLKCVCLDTEYIPVPLVHLLEFKDNYRELGSIIATKWVNDCVNIYTSEEALLTTREAVFYVCCILVDMLLTFREEFEKIK